MTACLSRSMTKPTIKQVQQDGLLVWEVSHGGPSVTSSMTGRPWFYESCVRYYRTKILGKGLSPSSELGV